MKGVLGISLYIEPHPHVKIHDRSKYRVGKVLSSVSVSFVLACMNYKRHVFSG